MATGPGHLNGPAAGRTGTICTPRPTYWPMYLALGVTLLLGGLITNLSLTVVGGLLSAVGLGGWIGDLLLPGKGEIEQPLAPPELRPPAVHVAIGKIDHLKPGTLGHRMRVPEQVHPYSAGVKGGIVGGVVMGLVALIYGLVSGHGVWYPVNLLAAMVVPGFEEEPAARLAEFSAIGLGVGLGIHASTALGVGLIYGMLLPMLPRYPLLWGGLVAPILWTGFIYGFMGVLNPVMDQHVEWAWYAVSQVAFGLAAGAVVMRSERVYVRQLWQQA